MEFKVTTTEYINTRDIVEIEAAYLIENGTKTYRKEHTKNNAIKKVADMISIPMAIQKYIFRFIDHYVYEDGISGSAAELFLNGVFLTKVTINSEANDIIMKCWLSEGYVLKLNLHPHKMCRTVTLYEGKDLIALADKINGLLDASQKNLTTLIKTVFEEKNE